MERAARWIHLSSQKTPNHRRHCIAIKIVNRNKWTFGRTGEVIRIIIIMSGRNMKHCAIVWCWSDCLWQQTMCGAHDNRRSCVCDDDQPLIIYGCETVTLMSNHVRLNDIAGDGTIDHDNAEDCVYAKGGFGDWPNNVIEMVAISNALLARDRRERVSRMWPESNSTGCSIVKLNQSSVCQIA